MVYFFWWIFKKNKNYGLIVVGFVCNIYIYVGGYLYTNNLFIQLIGRFEKLSNLFIRFFNGNGLNIFVEWFVFCFIIYLWLKLFVNFIL